MIFTDLRALLLDFNPRSEEYSVCSRFVDYLFDAQFKNIKSFGVGEKSEPVEHGFGYPHRWTENYVKGRYSKFYQLEDYLELNSELPMTFLSLTLKQKRDVFGNVIESVSLMEDYFRALSDAWKMLRRAILNMGIKIDYVGSVEPHQLNTGNPHHHTLILHKFTEEQKNILKKKYEEWGYGSFEHGLNFQDDVKIKNVRSYLLSYMLKSLPGYKSKFEGKEVKWTSSDLLFNAVAWDNKFRTWHASKRLTSIMKYDKYRNAVESAVKAVGDDSFVEQYREYLVSIEPKIEWLETKMEVLDSESVILWKKPVILEDIGG